MRKITVLSTNTLNGVRQAAGGHEGDESGVFRYGGWNTTYGDEVGGNLMQKELKQSAYYFLSGKTFDIWNSLMPKHRAIWLSLKRVFKVFNVPKSVSIIAILLFNLSLD